MSADFARYLPNDPERLRALIRYAEKNLVISRDPDEKFRIQDQIIKYKLELEELLASLNRKGVRHGNRQ